MSTAWAPKNPERAREYARIWRKNNPEKVKAISKRDYEKNKEKHYALCAKWASEHREENRQRANAKNAQLRTEAINAYGGKCVCCGEIEFAFLAIDHINGGGNKHRKIVGASSQFIRWLKKNNYPTGFQILCHNCNLAKGFYGACPHQSF